MKAVTTHIATSIVAAALLISTSILAADKPAVKITRDMAAVDVKHAGKKLSITRNQNQKNTVNPAFAKTSRKCPPFCIQPALLAPGVETIAELEVLDYLARMSAGDDSILVIDSRTPDWVKKGTIPGAINLPWTALNPAKGADPISIGEILVDQFGAKDLEGLWDYSSAKTLVMFCNGMWCGQSPNNIRNLLKFGYPAHKIKWYRGGMQDWEILGLSTVKENKPDSP
jgi:rhodanese-related sulfurtransferase